jgi:hypothetical protein
MKAPAPAPPPPVRQARIELPPDDMERVRRAGRSIGLSLTAFLRSAALEKTADTERRMKP